jgi:hypothetical protein
VDSSEIKLEISSIQTRSQPPSSSSVSSDKDENDLPEPCVFFGFNTSLTKKFKFLVVDEDAYN